MVQPVLTLRATARAMIVAGVGLLAPAVFACGFEDPAAMQTGILNWVYPRALYVGTAVWNAQLDGRIETDPPLATTSKLFVNPGYRKAIQTLREFGNRFSEHTETPETESFVVLLMEAMLWSRIVIENGQTTLASHIKTPDEGEAVIITHRVVLEAINRGKLAPAEAVDLGLMRLYGSEAAIARMMALLDRPVIAGEKTRLATPRFSKHLTQCGPVITDWIVRPAINRKLVFPVAAAGTTVYPNSKR